MNNWKANRRKEGLNKDYSILKNLRQEKKITDEFEVMFSALTLEEVISLKLELSSRLFKGKFFGIPIWKSLPYIVREATLKYALSVTKSKKDAARTLGLTLGEMNKMLRRYIPDGFG
jgi:hypothetical protein